MMATRRGKVLQLNRLRFSSSRCIVTCSDVVFVLATARVCRALFARSPFDEEGSAAREAPIAFARPRAASQRYPDKYTVSFVVNLFIDVCCFVDVITHHYMLRANSTVKAETKQKILLIKMGASCKKSLSPDALFERRTSKRFLYF